ncbi:hypothetical protein GCM10025871_18800 [Deinococcus metallilatus]|nr:hypothetical protein GCM10025871_18800 [Deinococcus metallilatus]
MAQVQPFPVQPGEKPGSPGDPRHAAAPEDERPLPVLWCHGPFYHVGFAAAAAPPVSRRRTSV